MIYGYYVDLDERGEFKADVRDASGTTIFEIDGSEIFEDGFMRHKHDISGLRSHLVDVKLIDKDAVLVDQRDFEQRMDDQLETGFEDDESDVPVSKDKPYDIWSDHAGKLCVTEAAKSLVIDRDPPSGFHRHEYRTLAANRAAALRDFQRLNNLVLAQRRDRSTALLPQHTPMDSLVIAEDLIDMVKAIDADRLFGVNGNPEVFFVVGNPAPIGGGGEPLGWYVDRDGYKQEATYPNPILVPQSMLKMLDNKQLIALRTENAPTTLKGMLHLNAKANDALKAVKARFDLNTMRVIVAEKLGRVADVNHLYEFVETDGDGWKKARLESAYIPINPHTGGPDYGMDEAIDLLKAFPNTEVRHHELNHLSYNTITSPESLQKYAKIAGLPASGTDWAAVMVKKNIVDGTVVALFAANVVEESLAMTRFVPVMLDGKVLEARLHEESALAAPSGEATPRPPAPEM